MEITPRELRDIEIHSEIRGYSRDEVNDLLERAAAAIEASNQRVTQLQDRLTSAQSETAGNRETEDILHRTLLLAQRAADEAVAEATAKSRQMLDEAEMSSRRLVADAEAEARRRGETERRRLEQEIVELAGRRDTLLADVEALTRFEAEYRERMVRALETDLSSLRARSTTAPGSKPEPSDVEMPAARNPVETAPGPTNAGAANAGAANAGATSPAETNPATSPAGNPAPELIAAVPETETKGSSAATAAEPAPGASNGSGRAPAPRTDEPAPGADQPAGAETSEVDVRTLWEQSQDKPRDKPRDAATPAAPGSPASEPSPSSASAKGQSTPAAGAARAAGLQPIDLAGSEGVDADVLDDDAFFATLRDAVHDEKPLGPREEGDEDVTGENKFFDQDADRGTFRDVFRRRR